MNEQVFAEGESLFGVPFLPSNRKEQEKIQRNPIMYTECNLILHKV